MKVTIYTTPTCPRCKILKDRLTAQEIDFTECQDVEEMEALGITEVPKLMVADLILSFGEAIAWLKTVQEQKKNECKNKTK